MPSIYKNSLPHPEPVEGPHPRIGSGAGSEGFAQQIVSDEGSCRIPLALDFIKGALDADYVVH